jgi:hypothetical protein
VRQSLIGDISQTRNIEVVGTAEDEATATRKDPSAIIVLTNYTFPEPPRFSWRLIGLS